MNIFTKTFNNVKRYLPVLRKPAINSIYDNLLNANYSWVLSNRNKQYGIGWNTYYRAGRNPYISACIRTYINEVLNLGFTIKSPEENYQNVERVNYLTNLFNNPMGEYSQSTFASFQSLMWHSYLLLGDAFAEVIYDKEFDGVPIGFKHIPNEFLKYDDKKDQWGFVDNSYYFEPYQLIHVKGPDIRGSVYGISPIDILAKDLTLDVLGYDFNKEILERKGLDPSGVIEFDSNLNDAAYNQEIARMKAMANTSNRRGTMVLRGASFKNVGISSEDMEYSKLMDGIRDKILAVYGVPPSKVCILETASLDFGSGKSQDQNFKKTFNGKARLFEDAFNKVLRRSAFRETFHYNEMDIEDKKVKAEIEDIRIRNGTITPNEVRRGYGQSPISDSEYNPLNTSKSANIFKDVLKSEGLLEY